MKRSELVVKVSKSLFESGYLRNLCNAGDSTWYFHSDGDRVKVEYSEGLKEVVWEHFSEDKSRPTDYGVGIPALKVFLSEGTKKEKDNVYRVEHEPGKGRLSHYRVYGPNSKYPVIIGHNEESDTWKGYNYGRDGNNLLGDDEYVSIIKRWKLSGKPTGTSDKVLTPVNKQYSGYEGPRFWGSHTPVGIPDKRPPFR